MKEIWAEDNLIVTPSQVRETDEILVCDSIAMVTTDAYSPMEVNSEVSSTTKIVAIEYFAEDLNSLTFVFSDGSRSPPRYTYTQEPVGKGALRIDLSDQSIAEITFGIGQDLFDEDSYSLASLSISDRNDHQICSISSSSGM